MKIGIISDTHDNLDKLRDALALFRRQNVGHIIHAGDWVSPFTVALLKKEQLPFFGVFGNNDGDRLLLDRFSGGNIHRSGTEVEIDGLRILVLHEPDNLEALAASGFFDLIIHGHDHKPSVTTMRETIVVNPGECGGWVSGKATAAVFDTSGRLARLHEIG